MGLVVDVPAFSCAFSFFLTFTNFHLFDMPVAKDGVVGSAVACPRGVKLVPRGEIICSCCVANRDHVCWREDHAFIHAAGAAVSHWAKAEDC